jgi:hypothetical protein
MEPEPGGEMLSLIAALSELAPLAVLVTIVLVVRPAALTAQLAPFSDSGPATDDGQRDAATNSQPALDLCCDETTAKHTWHSRQG